MKGILVYQDAGYDLLSALMTDESMQLAGLLGKLGG